jgi:hypothetical protein
MSRANLPQRRPATCFIVPHEAHEFHVTLGHYEDGGVGEVFIVPLDAAGKGSAIEGLARDAAILISLGLQHFVPLAVMRGAVTRDDQGRPATLIGAVVDAMPEKIKDPR